MPAFALKTPRLIIQPFTHAHLKDYYQEFTDEITKYQYPDSFSDIEAANQLVSTTDSGKKLMLQTYRIYG